MGFNYAVVGATGNVGREILQILAERTGFVTRNINLGQNIDPGSLAGDQITNLRERLYG